MNGDPSPKPAVPPAPRVLVSDRARPPLTPAARRSLAAMAGTVLTGEGIEGGELSLSFVGEAEMEDLHRRFMDEPGPTDVLSFPMDDRDEGPGPDDRLIGDVVVCPAVAARNNPADPEAELRLLVAHGVLHLLGYDHEDEVERAEMWARQEAYSGVASP